MALGYKGKSHAISYKQAYLCVSIYIYIYIYIYYIDPRQAGILESKEINFFLIKNFWRKKTNNFKSRK